MQVIDQVSINAEIAHTSRRLDEIRPDPQRSRRQLRLYQLCVMVVLVVSCCNVSESLSFVSVLRWLLWDCLETLKVSCCLEITVES